MEYDNEASRCHFLRCQLVAGKSGPRMEDITMDNSTLAIIVSLLMLVIAAIRLGLSINNKR
jgi:hypothetical protein